MQLAWVKEVCLCGNSVSGVQLAAASRSVVTVMSRRRVPTLCITTRLSPGGRRNVAARGPGSLLQLQDG
jgi:hypothetical protein